MPEPKPTVRFSPDHGFEWCLWFDDGTAYPDELGLSEALQEQILAWWHFWLEHSRFDGDGWDTQESHNIYSAVGDVLAAWLRQELPDYEVVDRHRY